MSLANLTSRTWDENVLFTVMLELTYACNLDCFFCYNDRAIKGKPLSTEQYFQFMEDLRDMQVLNLVLSGGEPLAHPDFFKIGAKARELGFVTRIKSNGHALNHRLARRLKKEVDPFNIDISLHGASPETHDRQTRVPGSFDQLLENFDILREMELRFRLNATLTAWNEHELEDMFEIAYQQNVPFNISSAVTPKDNGDETPLSIVPSHKAISKAHAIAMEWKRPGSQSVISNEDNVDKCTSQFESAKQCGTGSSTLTIDPVGNILPCVQWRRPVGNLHRDSVKDIWKNSSDLDEIRATAVQAKELVDSYGDKGRLMGYCIGEAVCQTGSPLKIYSNAKRQMDSRIPVVIK